MLVTIGGYSAAITYAIRSRPTFREMRNLIDAVVAGSPYAQDQRMIEERLTKLDGHILRLEDKVDQLQLLIQHPRLQK